MGARRKYQIKHLNPRHREILRRYILGMQPADIARDLKITEAAVYYTVNSELGQAWFVYMRMAARASTKKEKEIIMARKEVELRILEDLIQTGRWIYDESE